jgi:ribose 5-phosphate isomerase B
VLCVSLRTTSEAQAEEILDSWLATAYPPNPDDDACLGEVRWLEEDYRRAGAGAGTK